MPPLPFADIWQRAKVLTGCAIVSGSPRLTEVAARIGFDVIWIDLEHTSTDIQLAEHLCLATEAGGAIPLVRAAGWRREHVLQALEVGGKIVVGPMVNDAPTARGVADFGKFPPLGRRGYNTMSRGLHYGFEPPVATQATANRTTYLLPQIETLEAVGALDDILAVAGLSGIFIGPGDLSASLGIPGEFAHPKLIAIVCDCIRRTRAAGKHAGILVMNAQLMEAALGAGADLCVMSSDLGPLKVAWAEQLTRFI